MELFFGGPLQRWLLRLLTLLSYALKWQQRCVSCRRADCAAALFDVGAAWTHALGTLTCVHPWVFLLRLVLISSEARLKQCPPVNVVAAAVHAQRHVPLSAPLTAICASFWLRCL